MKFIIPLYILAFIIQDWSVTQNDGTAKYKPIICGEVYALLNPKIIEHQTLIL